MHACKRKRLHLGAMEKHCAVAWLFRVLRYTNEDNIVLEYYIQSPCAPAAVSNATTIEQANQKNRLLIAFHRAFPIYSVRRLVGTHPTNSIIVVRPAASSAEREGVRAVFHPPGTTRNYAGCFASSLVRRCKKILPFVDGCVAAGGRADRVGHEGDGEGGGVV